MGEGAGEGDPLLERRLADAELRARAAEEAADLRRRELAAMEDDLRALDRHVGHLEHGRLVLEIELQQVRQRAAELFADLERDEAVIAELGAEIAELKAKHPSSASIDRALTRLLGSHKSERSRT